PGPRWQDPGAVPARCDAVAELPPRRVPAPRAAGRLDPRSPPRADAAGRRSGHPGGDSAVPGVSDGCPGVLRRHIPDAVVRALRDGGRAGEGAGPRALVGGTQHPELGARAAAAALIRDFQTSPASANVPLTLPMVLLLAGRLDLAAVRAR